MRRTGLRKAPETPDAAPHCPDCGREMLWEDQQWPHKGRFYCENCPSPGKYAEDHNVCPTCFHKDNESCWHDHQEDAS